VKTSPGLALGRLDEISVASARWWRSICSGVDSFGSVGSVASSFRGARRIRPRAS
jgi:hypothetical protein